MTEYAIGHGAITLDSSGWIIALKDSDGIELLPDSFKNHPFLRMGDGAAKSYGVRIYATPAPALNEVLYPCN